MNYVVFKKVRKVKLFKEIRYIPGSEGTNAWGIDGSANIYVKHVPLHRSLESLAMKCQKKKRM